MCYITICAYFCLFQLTCIKTQKLCDIIYKSLKCFGCPKKLRQCFFLVCFSLYENICDNLLKFEVLGCPKTLRNYGVQCSCPFKAGPFSVRNLPLNIPKVRGFARAFIRVRVSGFLIFIITFYILHDFCTLLNIISIMINI